ncbi:MAG: EutN/CcmL family microcompartment protein [Geminicoccaceae bacterium]
MRLARVTGTVTATVKEAGLAGTKLLVVDVEDGIGNVLEFSLVAADTCGAGVGDMVLLTTGSAARLSSGAGTLPVDVAIIAVVDHVEIAGRSASTSSSRKRKK